MTEEAIILASGLGKRLRELKGDLPKCFHKLESQPMLSYPLRALKTAGINRFVIVVPRGYSQRAERIVGGFSVKIIENDSVEKGNAYSLFLGLQNIEAERFVVSCCDSIYPPSAILKLFSQRGEADVLVAMSRNSSYIDPSEATKIKVEEGRVKNIGKKLSEFDGYDIGLFLMSKNVKEVVKEIEWNREVNLFEFVQLCVDSGLKVFTADIGKIPWTEIDTPEDYWELLGGKRRKVLETFYQEVNF